MSALAALLALAATVTLVFVGWHYRWHAYAWWVYLRRPRRVRTNPNGTITIRTPDDDAIARAVRNGAITAEDVERFWAGVTARLQEGEKQ